MSSLGRDGLRAATASLMILAASSAGAGTGSSTNAAAADDLTEFNAYLRTGPVRASAQGAPRGGYSLGLPGQKLRLGNEGDFYGETRLGRAFRLGNGMTLRAVWGAALSDPTPTPDHLGYTLKQAFVELQGLPGLSPLAAVWAGRRPWQRESLYIVDTDYLSPDNGQGVGVHGLPAGPGLFGAAYFIDSGQRNAAGERVRASRLSLDWSALPVSPRGDLRVQGSIVHGRFSGKNDGQSLSLRHRLAPATPGVGIDHITWLQFSWGQGALNNGFGAFDAPAGRTAQRLVHAIEGQSGALGGQALAGIERGRTSGARHADTGWVAGGRLSWDVARHAKLLLEAGYNERRPDDGGPVQRLTKLTFAPTLSGKPGFNGRPELRLFATHIRMNSAAAAALAMPGRTRNVTLIGLQLETWI